MCLIENPSGNSINIPMEDNVEDYLFGDNMKILFRNNNIETYIFILIVNIQLDIPAVHSKLLEVS